MEKKTTAKTELKEGFMKGNISGIIPIGNKGSIVVTVVTTDVPMTKDTLTGDIVKTKVEKQLAYSEANFILAFQKHFTNNGAWERTEVNTAAKIIELFNTVKEGGSEIKEDFFERMSGDINSAVGRASNSKQREYKAAMWEKFQRVTINGAPYFLKSINHVPTN